MCIKFCEITECVVRKSTQLELERIVCMKRSLQKAVRSMKVRYIIFTHLDNSWKNLLNLEYVQHYFHNFHNTGKVFARHRVSHSSTGLCLL